jgi:hypothetical protein
MEGNELRFWPELARIDDAREGNAVVSTVWGTWPDNTWLALSASSDAGPSWSDLYHWNPSSKPDERTNVPSPGWVKRHEYYPWVFDGAPWRGGYVALSKPYRPLLTAPDVREYSGSGEPRRRRPTSACQPSTSNLAPLWIHDGALTLFGYECSENGDPPASGSALVQETWSGEDTRTQLRSALPEGVDAVDQVIVEPKGVAAVLPQTEHSPRRIARFDHGRWVTVANLPADFVSVAAPTSLLLWGVSPGFLLTWQGSDWSYTMLPPNSNGGDWVWRSVWARGETDVWLIASKVTPGTASESYLLFNTADGRRATSLPNARELGRLGRDPTRGGEWDVPVTCSTPFRARRGQCRQCSGIRELPATRLAHVAGSAASAPASASFLRASTQRVRGALPRRAARIQHRTGSRTSNRVVLRH